MVGVKFMPLPKSQCMKGPQTCEGGLLMVEITEEVFVPGAKRWKEVVDMAEHRKFLPHPDNRHGVNN
jgi:hypothetical protein